MNKKLILSIAMLAMLLPVNAVVKTSHFIQFWGEGGARQYTGTFNRAIPQLGFLGDVGIGYEFRAGWFVINTGVGFAVPTFRLNVEDMTSSFYGQDDEGDYRHYNYVSTGRVERYNGFNLQVPLMFGIQLKKFYMLIGAKGDFNMWTASHIRANIAAQGVYDDFIDPFENMPEHTYYEGTSIRQHHAVRFGPDVNARLELGWRFGTPTLATGFDVNKSKWQYRLGFFLDYGLLNITPEARYTRGIIALPDDATGGLSDIQLHDLVATSGWASDIKQFTVGVKFTALFHVTPWWSCLVCEQLSPRAKPQKGERNWKW